MSLRVIVRETTPAAWAAANALSAPIDDTAIPVPRRRLPGLNPKANRRMSALHQGRHDQLELAPNLWAGVGLVRSGAGTALIGSADEVAERIREYEALGIDTFILSVYLHLEEACRMAELLFPRLGHAGGVAPTTAWVARSGGWA